MENFQVPVIVEWSGQRVLLSAQLAKAYGCSSKNISDNFNRAKEQFTEGVHYFKLEGLVLRSFREYSEKIGLVIPLNTPRLYLWTYKGCVRHCKMINTSQAWAVFDALEQHYFNSPPLAAETAPVAEKPQKNQKRADAQNSPARVYVFLLVASSFFAVKIGLSKDLETRKKTVERETNATVCHIYKTSLLPRKIARLLEKLCKEYFSSSRLSGEYFFTDYNEVCKVLNMLEKMVEALPSVNDHVRAEELLQIADTPGNTPERKNILIEAANIIAGKKVA